MTANISRSQAAPDREARPSRECGFGVVQATPKPHPYARYSKRTVDGAVIRRSRGSVTVMTAKAITRPMPMIVK